MKVTKTIIILMGLLALASSCTVNKEIAKPEAEIPDNFRFAGSIDSTSMATLKWRTFFTDILLQHLIENGISKNYDIQSALANISIAQEKLKQAKFMQFPEISIGIMAQTNTPSQNSLNGKTLDQFIGQKHIEDYNLGMNISWEADIWKKIDQQKQAVKLSYLQTFEASKAIQTQIVAEIAQGYYTLQMLDEQLKVAKENILLAGQTETMTKKMWDNGEGTLLAVQQASAQKQHIEALHIQLEQQIALQENALSILTGVLPDKIERKESISDTAIPQVISTGFPAEMLGRRPDVRMHELAILESNSRMNIAKANMYPTLRITASTGINSFMLDNWFQIPASLFGSVLGGLTQPIFKKRELKTQYEITRIEREKQVIAFRQSVLNATGEVSDAIVSVQKLNLLEQKNLEQLQTLNGAVSTAEKLYKNGSVNYLEVITAQSRYLQSELDQFSLKRDRLSTIILLYRALGGGWQ